MTRTAARRQLERNNSHPGKETTDSTLKANPSGNNLFEAQGKPIAMILVMKCNHCDDMQYVHFLRFKNDNNLEPLNVFDKLGLVDIPHIGEVHTQKDRSLVSGYFNCGVYKPYAVFEQISHR